RSGGKADGAVPAARPIHAATRAREARHTRRGRRALTMDRLWLAVLGTLALLFGAWNLAFFTVPQWMQAMVVQLGEPVRVVREPGLYWKIPFIQQVTYCDRRLRDYDASPKEILTVDKQQLVVDNFTRWLIADPLQFYRTVRDENGAQSRLNDIIYPHVSDTTRPHNLSAPR